MIDLALLRTEPEQITQALLKKDPNFPVSQLIELDKQLRSIRAQVEQLRSEKNELARQAGSGGITDEVRQRSIAVGKELKSLEQQLQKTEIDFKKLYLTCPNIPLADVPKGNKESNKVIKTFQEKIIHSFEPKHHMDLGTKLGWFDFDAATTMTGSNFALYKGDAVKLMYALTMFMLKNNIKHGYNPVIPPYLVNEQSLQVAGNFPKFKEDVFAVPGDNLFLTPTAEANLSNFYRNKIVPIDQLPVRMTSWTSCFRREAGGYGATERGLIRMHQFEKVELFALCEPQNVIAEQEKMLACAEDILQQLGLHYQVSLLAAQDCSFASAKTYDIEVWLPGQKSYYEVSSVSNCTDFQSRRGKIRYKKDAKSGTQLVYTLNGSSLALSRLMVAIMEVYQQADGSIAIPEVLKSEGIF